MEFLVDGPGSAPQTLVLAHGAGAPMDSPFLAAVAAGIARGGFRVVRFEFPYMAERRATGVRRPPNSQKRLLDTWLIALRELGDPKQLVIGGKSLGGRMASLIADEVGARGLVVLGYPFHPPGKLDRLRTEHLRALATPTLILQGERDAFGSREEVAHYSLSSAIEMRWIPDGDHSWAPRAASGHTEESNLAIGVGAACDFLRML